MKKGQKLDKRQDWYVDKHLLGSKFNQDYAIHALKTGFSMILSSKINKGSKMYDDTSRLEMCAIISMMALTGARVSEVLNLKFIDLTLDKDVDGTGWIVIYMPNIKQKKGSKKEIKKIPLMVDKSKDIYFLYEIIDTWYLKLKSEIELGISANQIREPEIFNIKLFPSFSRTLVHRYSSKYCQINPHGLRKIRGHYLVVEKEMPLKVVQRLLGHRNLDNLEFYFNLRTTDIKESIKRAESS
jgi:integrase